MADTPTPGKLIGLDGRRIEKEPLRMPVIEFRGHQFPIRTLRHEKLFEHDPKTAFTGLVIQSSDFFQISMVSMVALAADIYSRMPQGSCEFRNLMQSFGLTFRDAEGNGIDAVELLDEALKAEPKKAPVDAPAPQN